MTHRVLGVRADRVVAHGPAPRGFLVHGGEPTLWTAYVTGGAVPRGESFARVVATSPQAPASTRRRSNDRFRATDAPICCTTSSRSVGGSWPPTQARQARDYLSSSAAFPGGDRAVRARRRSVVPCDARLPSLVRLHAEEIEQSRRSRRLALARPPVRRAGATSAAGSRRSGRGHSTHLDGRPLPVPPRREPDEPAAVRPVVGSQETPRPRDLVLVEGLLDVIHLRAHGVEAVAALGGTGTRATLFERLADLGFERVTLCLDRDAAGRAATAKAVDTAASRARAARRSGRRAGTPGSRQGRGRVRAASGEFDALAGTRGRGECGITWRSLDLASSVDPASSAVERRDALAGAGRWLGALPPRLALEQEDALTAVAARCGYSPPAVARTFRARFWQRRLPRAQAPEHAPSSVTMEASLLSPEEVAAQCGLSRKAIYRAIERGELRAARSCARGCGSSPPTSTPGSSVIGASPILSRRRTTRSCTSRDTVSGSSSCLARRVATEPVDERRASS